MLRMQVYLPEDLVTALRTRAVVDDVSMSDLVRKGLDKILKSDNKKADPMKEFVGKLRTKKKTNSVKLIRDYYKGILK